MVVKVELRININEVQHSNVSLIEVLQDLESQLEADANCIYNRADVMISKVEVTE